MPYLCKSSTDIIQHKIDQPNRENRMAGFNVAFFAGITNYCCGQSPADTHLVDILQPGESATWIVWTVIVNSLNWGQVLLVLLRLLQRFSFHKAQIINSACLSPNSSRDSWSLPGIKAFFFLLLPPLFYSSSYQQRIKSRNIVNL